MKRTTIFISMLVLLLSVGLVSCDAMFNTNLFAGIANKPASADEIAAKSPSELQAYISGSSRLDDLANDAAKKDAALTALAAYYAPPTGSPAPVLTSPEVQTAAIVAAEIAIKTVPEASGLSGSIIAYLTTSKISTATTADVTTMIEGVLPKDIADALAMGGDMPPAFSGMIDAFVQANTAFQALGEGIASVGGAAPAYADGTSVSTSDKTSIAVNAVIAGLLSAVTPAVIADPVAGPTSEERATALWIALSDPNTVNPTNPTPPITISTDTFNKLIGQNADGTPSLTPSPIANLLTASGLDNMFSTKPSTGGV